MISWLARWTLEEEVQMPNFFFFLGGKEGGQDIKLQRRSSPPRSTNTCWVNDLQGEGVSIMNHTVAFQGWQQCTRDRGALIRRDPKCFSNTNLLPHRNCQGHKSRLKQRHLCWRTPRFFLASLKRKLLYHVRGPHIPNCKVLQWLIGGGKREDDKNRSEGEVP